MKLRAFKQNKLWRDKAIDMLEAQGSVIHWQRLDDHEFMQELKTKLLEEAHEVADALDTKGVQQELADVLEVVKAVCVAIGCSYEDIVALQEKKKHERGGFDGRRFVTVAEHPEGSLGEKYCLNDPHKYPEVVE